MNNPSEPSRSHLASLDAARNLMNVQAAAATTTSLSLPDPQAELTLMTAGQVADLTHMMPAASDNNYYEPVDPFALRPSQAPPAAEVARLQTRLYSLKSKLANQQTQQR